MQGQRCIRAGAGEERISFVRECWDQKWSGSHRFECREYIWKSEKEEEKNSAARNEVERFYDDEYEEWDRLECIRQSSR